METSEVIDGGLIREQVTPTLEVEGKLQHTERLRTSEGMERGKELIKSKMVGGGKQLALQNLIKSVSLGSTWRTSQDDPDVSITWETKLRQRRRS